MRVRESHGKRNLGRSTAIEKHNRWTVPISTPRERSVLQMSIAHDYLNALQSRVRRCRPVGLRMGQHKNTRSGLTGTPNPIGAISQLDMIRAYV